MRILPNIATLALSLVAVSGVIACNPGEATGPSVPAAENFAASLNVNLATMTKYSDDLYYKDVVVGTGATAANGSSVTVVYTGYLVDGSKFDSNVGKALFTVVLGQHKVITGWDVGLVGMKVGGTRRLVIGSSYGYGASGSPPVIPRNATLVFDVELKSIP